MLADGLVNAGLWLGPVLTAPEAAAFALSWQAGNAPAQQADARHANDNPRAPLYWLVNFLSGRGLGLKAGQAVITGSFAGLLTLPTGQAVRFRYGELAKFEVTFQSAD